MNEIRHQNMLSLLHNNQVTDVIFRVGNKDTGIKDIRGVRALFAAQSEILNTMLYGHMAEADAKNVVVIEDICPIGFEWFKHYCYGLNSPITIDNVIGILHILDKYCMTSLYNVCLKECMTKCIQKESDEMDMDRLFFVLTTMDSKKLDKIIDDIVNSEEFGCMSKIECKNLLSSKQFTSLSPNVANKILFKSGINFMELLNPHNLWFFCKYYCEALCKDTKSDLNLAGQDKDKDKEQEKEKNQMHDTQDEKKEENKNDNVGLDEESSDENQHKPPPSKRRRLMQKYVMNSKNSSDESFDWLDIMRDNFISDFDFSKMDSSFFVENIGIYGDCLMDVNKRLDILETFAVNGNNFNKYGNDIGIFEFSSMMDQSDLEFDIYNSKDVNINNSKKNWFQVNSEIGFTAISSSQSLKGSVSVPHTLNSNCHIHVWQMKIVSNSRFNILIGMCQSTNFMSTIDGCHIFAKDRYPLMGKLTNACFLYWNIQKGCGISTIVNGKFGNSYGIRNKKLRKIYTRNPNIFNHAPNKLTLIFDSNTRILYFYIENSKKKGKSDDQRFEMVASCKLDDEGNIKHPFVCLFGKINSSPSSECVFELQTPKQFPSLSLCISPHCHFNNVW